MCIVEALSKIASNARRESGAARKIPGTSQKSRFLTKDLF